MTKPIALLALLALAACAGSAPSQDSFYRLETTPPATRFAAPVLPGVIEVAALETDGLLGERPLVYQDANGSLARYHVDLWTAPPGILLQERLAETLTAVGAATTVVTPNLRVPPDWMVRGALKRFELVPQAGKVQLRLQLAVISARDGTPFLLRTYDVERTADATPASEAKALDQAASEALASFVADIAKVDVPKRK